MITNIHPTDYNNSSSYPNTVTNVYVEAVAWHFIGTATPTAVV